MYKDAEGRIILDPNASIPASEPWLSRNGKAAASVGRGLDQVAAGKVKRAQSFAQFAGDDE